VNGAAGTRARVQMRLPRVPTRRALLIILLLMGLTACGSLGQHRVQSGETLYAISFRYGWDYRDVAEWNALKPPYTIYEGQMLRVAPPVGGGGRYTAAADDAPSPAPVIRPSAPSLPAAPITRAPPTPAVAPVRPTHAPIQWRWPTEGTLVHSYSEEDAARKGIDIGGRLGQPVRASAAGRIVYAGSGLLNYGNLLIIKHNDNFLSAYGYNRRLRVKEGDEVVAGQYIADMGNKGNGDALLHFQIRFDGRPVNPLRYLPPLQQ